MTDLLPMMSLANELADLARIEILPRFRIGLDVDDKPDSSPVTDADRAAERVMRSRIAQAFPNHGIIGEEEGAQNAGAEWVWVLDPVDGTKSFIIGRPTFTTLIGLMHCGKPVLGVIDQPVTRERWVGVEDMVTTLNGVPVGTSKIDVLSSSRLGSTGPQYLPGDALARFGRISSQCRFTVWGGDAYLYALLAMGGVELVIESGLKLHDMVALAPVVKGAGGVMTDWEGQEIHRDSKGDVLVAANQTLHAIALRLLSGEV